MEEAFDVVIQDFIDFANRQSGMYMDAVLPENSYARLNAASRPKSCCHPLVMAMQTTDLLKFDHRALLGWLHRP